MVLLVCVHLHILSQGGGLTPQYPFSLLGQTRTALSHSLAVFHKHILVSGSPAGVALCLYQADRTFLFRIRAVGVTAAGAEATPMGHVSQWSQLRP